MTNDPLANLRDIHLPPPVSWWPLAWGWYVLFVVALVMVVALTIWLCRHWKARQQRQQFMQQLSQLRRRYQREEDNVAIAVALSTLLRRAALSIYPREKVAGLHQQAWLNFLNETGNTTAFTDGEGRVLVTAPYQAQAKYQMDRLFVLIQAWLEKNLNKK